MALRQGRDAVCPTRARIPLGPDAEPRVVDERDGERAGPVPFVRPERQMRGECLAQFRQSLAEHHEPVVLALLLRCAERRVVEVLAPAGPVDSGRLELRPRVRRDPDVLPRRRDDEAVDALERLLVGDRPIVRVDVAKALRPLPPPPPAPRHRLSVVGGIAVEREPPARDQRPPHASAVPEAPAAQTSPRAGGPAAGLRRTEDRVTPFRRPRASQQVPKGGTAILT